MRHGEFRTKGDLRCHSPPDIASSYSFLASSLLGARWTMPLDSKSSRTIIVTATNPMDIYYGLILLQLRGQLLLSYQGERSMTVRPVPTKSMTVDEEFMPAG
jgi:hypothetical protein